MGFATRLARSRLAHSGLGALDGLVVDLHADRVAACMHLQVADQDFDRALGELGRPFAWHDFRQYDLDAPFPEVLVPRYLRLPVRGRIGAAVRRSTPGFCSIWLISNIVVTRSSRRWER